MSALTRSVHAAKFASAAHSTPRGFASGLRLPLAPRDSSEVIGVVVEVLGEHAAAVELERTGAGQFREEIVVHGHPGWTRDLEPGTRV